MSGVFSFSLRGFRAEETLQFEEVYEQDLRSDLEEKRQLIDADGGVHAWMRVDGVLVGEIIGLPPKSIVDLLDEDLPDLDPSDEDSIYCYSCTVLPAYQRRGYGVLLHAWWMGKCEGRYDGLSGPTRIIGHATSDSMVHLARSFGARFDPDRVHPQWFDTDRTARYYEIDLR